MVRRSHEGAPLPNCPTQETSRPTPYLTYSLPRYYFRRAAPFHFAAHRWKNVSLVVREIHSPCSSFTIVMAVEGGGGDSEAAAEERVSEGPCLPKIVSPFSSTKCRSAEGRIGVPPHLARHGIRVGGGGRRWGGGSVSRRRRSHAGLAVLDPQSCCENI